MNFCCIQHHLTLKKKNSKFITNFFYSLKKLKFIQKLKNNKMKTSIIYDTDEYFVNIPIENHKEQLTQLQLSIQNEQFYQEILKQSTISKLSDRTLISLIVSTYSKLNGRFSLYLEYKYFILNIASVIGECPFELKPSLSPRMVPTTS